MSLESEPKQETKAPNEKEDDQLVLIQFTDIDDANYCQHFSQKFKSLEIQSEKPIIQIGNRFYSGEYTNNIGTYLFFEPDQEQEKLTTRPPQQPSIAKQSDKPTQPETTESTSAGDPADLSYKYSGKSFKRLVLSRLFIEENTENKTTP